MYAIRSYYAWSSLAVTDAHALTMSDAESLTALRSSSECEGIALVTYMISDLAGDGTRTCIAGETLASAQPAALAASDGA